MVIKKLTLQNFRNYESETFSFSEGLNVLSGRNAQGKTNCAEAVFYLCTGSPLRIRHEKQLIRFGQERAYLAAETLTRSGTVRLEAEITESGRTLFVNGNKVGRFVDFLGHMTSVFFSPGELRLVQDGPDERRRFLNLSISQTAPSYGSALLRYQRILDQRNNLLKSKDVDTVLSTLPVWDEQLSVYAARIIRARREFIKELSPLAAEAHAYLTDGGETLSVGAEGSYPETEEEIAKKLVRDMASAYERDIRLGYTTVGPHRDDLKITIDGADARGGSEPETCRGEDIRKADGRASRSHSRRRDERAGFAPQKEARRAHAGTAMHSHLHARGTRSVRRGEHENQNTGG